MKLENENPTFVRDLFSRIAYRYDLNNSILSGGFDYFWRRKSAKLVASWKPTTVLDLATGSGALAAAIHKHAPGITIVGADFCFPLLKLANSRRQLPTLVVADGLNLPFADHSFDVVTIAFGLRNMASYPKALSEIARVLKPSGHILILDFSLPKNRLLRAIYCLYLQSILPAIAAIFSGERQAYDYLARSIGQFPSGQAMLTLMQQCGFQNCKAQQLTGGVVSLYEGQK